MTCVLLKEHLHNRRWASCVAFLTLALLLSARAAPAPQLTNLPPAASLTRSLADSPPANLKPETLKLETTYLQQAAYYYARYHALAPDDLLGLKRLVGVCTALEGAGVEEESCRRYNDARGEEVVLTMGGTR